MKLFPRALRVIRVHYSVFEFGTQSIEIECYDLRGINYVKK